MALRPRNASFHDPLECPPWVAFPSLKLEPWDPVLAAGVGDRRMGFEQLGEEPRGDWDDSEADEPPPELPWEAWDPLDDEPEELEPRDFWPDLPDEDDD